MGQNVKKCAMKESFFMGVYSLSIEWVFIVYPLSTSLTLIFLQLGSLKLYKSIPYTDNLF